MTDTTPTTTPALPDMIGGCDAATPTMRAVWLRRGAGGAWQVETIGQFSPLADAEGVGAPFKAAPFILDATGFWRPAGASVGPTIAERLLASGFTDVRAPRYDRRTDWASNPPDFELDDNLCRLGGERVALPLLAELPAEFSRAFRLAVWGVTRLEELVPARLPPQVTIASTPAAPAEPWIGDASEPWIDSGPRPVARTTDEVCGVGTYPAINLSPEMVRRAFDEAMDPQTRRRARLPLKLLEAAQADQTTYAGVAAYVNGVAPETSLGNTIVCLIERLRECEPARIRAYMNKAPAPIVVQGSDASVVKLATAAERSRIGRLLNDLAGHWKQVAEYEGVEPQVLVAAAGALRDVLELGTPAPQQDPIVLRAMLDVLADECVSRRRALGDTNCARAEVLTEAFAAAKDAGNPGPRWRLLTEGEEIAAGDEVWVDGLGPWTPVTAAIGFVLGSFPVRRRVDGPPGASS